MKNFVKLFGIIALALVIGLSITACADEGSSTFGSGGGGSGGGGGDSSRSPLIGTWVDSDNIRITFSDRTYEMYEGSTPVSKGNYTTSGNYISLTATHIYLTSYDSYEYNLSSGWYSKQDIRNAYIQMALAEAQGMPQWMVDMMLDEINAGLDQMLGEMFDDFSYSGNYQITGNKLYFYVYGDTLEFTKTN